MKKQSGFTLIEVLISMLVLAVGLLGLAALQATGLRNNLSAYNRSQATLLAYDMAERMRANVADTSNLATSIYNTQAGTAQLITANDVQNDCNVVSITCTASDMARNDLFEWNRDVRAMLPLGQGLIVGELVGVAPNQTMMYDITISWDDNRNGNRDLSFQMSFQL